MTFLFYVFTTQSIIISTGSEIRVQIWFVVDANEATYNVTCRIHLPLKDNPMQGVLMHSYLQNKQKKRKRLFSFTSSAH
jgi:hypothetical protein